MLTNMLHLDLNTLELNKTVYYKIQGKFIKVKITDLKANRGNGIEIATYSQKYGNRYINDSSKRFFYIRGNAAPPR